MESTMDGTDEIARLLGGAVHSQVVPGIAAMVARSDGSVLEYAFGRANVATSTPMTPDTPLRLASMTKLLTVIVAYRTLQAHAYALDVPVGDIVPEFDDLQVLVGFDGDAPLLRRPASRATVRQLITHTSGLGYDLWNAELLRYESAIGLPGMATGSRRAFRAPLMSDPGTQFEYGNSTDWLGAVAEAVRGKDLARLYRETITGPLGMNDTVVALSPQQRQRSAPAHVRVDGRWEISDMDYAQEPEFIAGGHALYSTPRDFMKLQRALLEHGRSESGAQVIPEDLVRAMSQNHLGDVSLRNLPSAMPDLVADLKFSPEAEGWGPGLLVSTRDRSGGRSRGSFGWLGMYNTAFWVDPHRQLAAGIFCQAAPFLEPSIHALLDAFEKAVYRSA